MISSIRSRMRGPSGSSKPKLDAEAAVEKVKLGGEVTAKENDGRETLPQVKAMEVEVVKVGDLIEDMGRFAGELFFNNMVRTFWRIENIK